MIKSEQKSISSHSSSATRYKHHRYEKGLWNGTAGIQKKRAREVNAENARPFHWIPYVIRKCRIRSRKGQKGKETGHKTHQTEKLADTVCIWPSKKLAIYVSVRKHVTWDKRFKMWMILNLPKNNNKLPSTVCWLCCTLASLTPDRVPDGTCMLLRVPKA